MKRLITIASLFLSSYSLFAQQQQLQRLIKQYGIPGIQLVCIKGDKEENFNLGTISTSSGKKVTSTTIFEAASLSKCVFAYTVLRLYDKGIINLDTPLLHYIGSYNRFNPADPRYAKITARIVLCHRTGLPNWGDSILPLLFEPDSIYSYSGEGFQFLQHVVEKITGKSLNELAQQEVFTPLGMTNSSYTWVDRFDTVAAFGNNPDIVSDYKTQRAASSLLSCAHDYAIFLRALMTGKGLKPDTYKMMLEHQSAGNWFNHRSAEDMKYLSKANNNIWWGLGIGLQENETGRWAWQWGDNGDFKGFCIVNPKTKEALVYFTYSKWGLHITSDVLNDFFPNQTWWPPVWIGYEFYEKKNMLAFWSQLDKQGYDDAMGIAQSLKQKDAAFLLPESDVNDLAFILLGRKMNKEATDIFKYNISVHPNSSGAYESLAEGYESIGEKKLAVENYKKAIDLNPNDGYSAGRIKELESETNQ